MRGRTRGRLTAISGKAGNADIAISVVTLIEMAHGAARADTSQRKEKRQQFIQELLTALLIHPVIAHRTGRYRWTSCFRDSVVFTSLTCWHTMPRSTQSFPVSHPNHGELVFDSEYS